jgi:hypothetical protein
MILECSVYIAESLANLADHMNMNRPDSKEKRSRSQMAANCQIIMVRDYPQVETAHFELIPDETGIPDA